MKDQDYDEPEPRSTLQAGAPRRPADTLLNELRVRCVPRVVSILVASEYWILTSQSSRTIQRVMKSSTLGCGSSFTLAGLLATGWEGS